ncbi:MAG: 30S ribosomal protein S27ae [Candidatus Woesearchaeota archaeon]
MAAKPAAKSADKKGGAPVPKGKQYHMYKIYEVSGSTIKRKNKTCPKCSVFMANHKDRWTCGKCGYMEKR